MVALVLKVMQPLLHTSSDLANAFRKISDTLRCGRIVVDIIANKIRHTLLILNTTSSVTATLNVPTIPDPQGNFRLLVRQCPHPRIECDLDLELVVPNLLVTTVENHNQGPTIEENHYEGVGFRTNRLRVLDLLFDSQSFSFKQQSLVQAASPTSRR